MEDAKFVRDTEPYRRELLAHCYRLLGSAHDAEDLVQETYLRAWRAYGRFEGRSSVRNWLYRIATNACLSALTGKSRRMLPAGLGGPGEDPLAPPEAPDTGVRWLEPLPDSLVTEDPNDPASIVVARESVRLALIAGLQYLPPSQRAVLILRDVLGWPAAEVAAALETTTVAVKSALQRARATLRRVDPADEVVEPTEPERRALLAGYVEAFQNADAAALHRVLSRDATIELPPSRTWFAGRASCVPYLANQVLGSPGDWRMEPAAVNGQPAVAAYRRDPDGEYRSFGIAVLTVSAAGIDRIVVFGGADLVSAAVTRGDT